MSRRSRISALAVPCTLVLASAAAAGPVGLVFSSIPGHPSSLVPGAAGMTFRHGAPSQFERPAASPSGRWWAVRAGVSDETATPGQAILVGDAAGEAVLVARTGQGAPAAHGLFTAFDPDVQIDDAGVFTFSATTLAEGVPTTRVYRGRIGAGGMPLLAPVQSAADTLASVAAEIPELDAPAEDAVAFSLAALAITPAGDWMARGTDAQGNEWVFRNGEPVALAGTPVTLRPDEPEHFAPAGSSPAFFSMHANSAGDIAIGGLTDAGEHAMAAAVVLNSQRVILRTGDAVDLDGNGLADDDAFIDAFSTDGAFLTDGGAYYFSADLRTAAGRVIGRALLRTDICKPDWDASGSPGSADLSVFLTEWLASVSEGTALADYDRDGLPTSADIGAFLSEWLGAMTGGC